MWCLLLCLTMLSIIFLLFLVTSSFTLMKRYRARFITPSRSLIGTIKVLRLFYRISRQHAFGCMISIIWSASMLLSWERTMGQFLKPWVHHATHKNLTRLIICKVLVDYWLFSCHNCLGASASHPMPIDRFQRVSLLLIGELWSRGQQIILW